MLPDETVTTGKGVFVIMPPGSREIVWAVLDLQTGLAQQFHTQQECRDLLASHGPPDPSAPRMFHVQVISSPPKRDEDPALHEIAAKSHEDAAAQMRYPHACRVVVEDYYSDERVFQFDDPKTYSVYYDAERNLVDYVDEGIEPKGRVGEH